MRSIGVLQNGGLKAAYASGLRSEHESSPRVHVGHRACRFVFAFRCPPRGCAERLGEVPRPRRPHLHASARMPFSQSTHGLPHAASRAAYGPGPNLFPGRAHHGSSVRLRSARDGFAACYMPQGLSLLPTRPVRANCRPDMHLDRPPVLPACVLQPLSRIVIPVGVWSPASWRTTASRCHATNTLAARPITERDAHNIFLLGIKSKIKFAAVKQCE
jgi:hypothetical protein